MSDVYGVWIEADGETFWLTDTTGVVFHTPFLAVAQAQRDSYCKSHNYKYAAKVTKFEDDGSYD